MGDGDEADQPQNVRRARSHRRERATVYTLEQLEPLREGLDKRQRLQSNERDGAAVDADLMRYWGSFLDGVGLVMRAAEAARSAWYRGGAPFLLTFYDLEDLMVRSRGCCELTGVPFSGETIPGSTRGPFVPSIDRIEPHDPYTPENVRLVCWAVNRALGRWGDVVFWKIVQSATSPRSSIPTPDHGEAGGLRDKRQIECLIRERLEARSRRTRKTRGTRSDATAQVEAQFEGQLKELQARELRQLRELDRKRQVALLARLWSHYPDGIGDVMEGARTALTGHLYHGRLPFLLTQPELESVMIRSKGRCELSGIPFSGEVMTGWQNRPFIPSLDRIKAQEPYAFANVRLVCWFVNRARGDWGDDVFWKLMRSAASRSQR
jgi:hypothetical protein